MPRRLLRKIPTDPEKRRIFIAATMLGMAGLIALIGWLAGDITSNSEKIEKRPTRSEIAELRYRSEIARTRERRRTCRQLNELRSDIRAVLEPQAPTAAKTSYYATHPDELAAAQRNFRKTLAVFDPKRCDRRYPFPDIESFRVPDGGRAPLTDGIDSTDEMPPGQTLTGTQQPPRRQPPRAPQRPRPAPAPAPPSSPQASPPSPRPAAPTATTPQAIVPNREIPRGTTGPVCDRAPTLPIC